ncbi:RbtT/DalT/CsbX family MFS transporter, partial [Mycetocola reblochoni]
MSATTPATPSRLERLGIPPTLTFGYLGLLLFMTGVGVDSNFITPHLVEALGSPEATVATIITSYSLAVLVGSYLSGALADLVGPKRVMALGLLIWVVFQVLFLLALASGDFWLTAITYTLRGFGYPIFAFGFLVWVNVATTPERNGTAVGWFYVAFTGGLPTLGSLFAIGAIPTFGGEFAGETGAMWVALVPVVLGGLVALLGIRDTRGTTRIAPAGDSVAKVMTAGIVLTFTNTKVLMGFLVRLINTAPQYGMFILLPAVIADERGWGQSKWLTMTVLVYATNILVNAVFGAVGDKIGWQRTVKWYGVFASALGLLAWWYVPQLVPAGSEWGFWLSTAAGCVFGCFLAGFVPMGAIMPALVPDRKGAAMAMYTTAAGGAAFLGAAVVALGLALGFTGAGIVWM